MNPHATNIQVLIHGQSCFIYIPRMTFSSPSNTLKQIPDMTESLIFQYDLLKTLSQYHHYSPNTNNYLILSNMQSVFKFPIASCVIFFPHFIDSGIFFCKVMGNEWVWKPLLCVFVELQSGIVFPLEITFQRKRYLNPNQMAALPRKQSPLYCPLWFFQERDFLTQKPICDFSKGSSVSFPSHARMPRPRQISLNASLHAWLRKQQVKKP